MSVDAVEQNEFIAQLIRHSLSDPVEPAAAPVELSEAEFDDLFMRCQQHRIVPLLMAAVSEGQFVIGDDQISELLDMQLQVMTTTVGIESLSLRAIETLESGGINVRVTKGVATAHLDYANPALRQFGDVDLLIWPDQFDDALSVLRDAGMKQKYPIRGGRWQVQHSVPIEGDGLEIDLHNRLLHQAAGHLAAKLDLFANPDTISVGGRPLRALPAPIRLIQAAGQNIVSAPADRKHSSDVDVLMLSQESDEAYELANSVGLGWLLDMGLSRAFRVAGLAPPEPRASDGLIERVMTRTYDATRPSAVRLALSEALVAPAGVTARSALGVVAPGDDYLAQRGRTQSDQLRRQLTRVKQLFSSPKH